MADLEGSSWIDIDAPIERCFDIIADVERAPEWQGAMQKAQALEYDAQGRPVLVETHIHAIVANVTLRLRFDYFEPTGMRWTRERGDLQVAVRRLATRGPWQRPNTCDLFTRDRTKPDPRTSAQGGARTC